jgi:hypothetical protein
MGSFPRAYRDSEHSHRRRHMHLQCFSLSLLTAAPFEPHGASAGRFPARSSLFCRLMYNTNDPRHAAHASISIMWRYLSMGMM